MSSRARDMMILADLVDTELNECLNIKKKKYRRVAMKFNIIFLEFQIIHGDNTFSLLQQDTIQFNKICGFFKRMS